MTTDRNGPDDPLSIEELQPYPLGLAAVDRRRRWRGWIGAAVVLVALIGVVGFAGSRRSGPPGPGDREDASVTIPEPIGLGSPIDGKASMRLPVRAFPDHDLVDGQQIKVIASGFRPNVQVGAVMCLASARTQGAAACDIGTVIAFGQTDPAGRVSIPYTFRRFPVIQGRKVDCRVGNIDPAKYEDRLRRKVDPAIPDGVWTACLLVIGQVDDYDQSGGWPVAMAGATFVDMPEAVPETTVAPSTEPPTTTAPTTAASEPTTIPVDPGSPTTIAPATTPSDPATSIPATSTPATTAPGPSGPSGAPDRP